jgi:hypothetical protein
MSHGRAHSIAVAAALLFVPVLSGCYSFTLDSHEPTALIAAAHLAQSEGDFVPRYSAVLEEAMLAGTGGVSRSEEFRVDYANELRSVGIFKQVYAPGDVVSGPTAVVRIRRSVHLMPDGAGALFTKGILVAATVFVLAPVVRFGADATVEDVISIELPDGSVLEHRATSEGRASFTLPYRYSAVFPELVTQLSALTSLKGLSELKRDPHLRKP